MRKPCDEPISPTNKRKRILNSIEDLDVYQLAYDLSMKIFHLSRHWPRHEQKALTDQALRSSRSVCANIAEAWRKRNYVRDFEHKLAIAHAENCEFNTWLSIAHDCGYLDQEQHHALIQINDRVGAMLYRMIKHSDQWCKN